MTETLPDLQEVAPVTVRKGTPRDEAFILATWLRSYKHGSMFARRITNDVFFTNHHPIVTDIVNRSDVLVAALEDDPGVILGYLVTEKQGPLRELHFAYVKKEFRRMRVLSQLLEESCLPADLEGVEVSHATFDWLDFMAPKFPGSRSNPYLFMPNPRSN
jgi:hypothetical protein